MIGSKDLRFKQNIELTNEKTTKNKKVCLET